MMYIPKYRPLLVIRTTAMHMLLDSVPFAHMHIHGHSLAPRAHKNAMLQEDCVTAVLSKASANTRASAHHPILTVFVVFRGSPCNRQPC